MALHNKLFIDNWFKLPPKVKPAKREAGKRHAKKSRQSSVKKESQKRG